MKSYDFHLIMGMLMIVAGNTAGHWIGSVLWTIAGVFNFGVALYLLPRRP